MSGYYNYYQYARKAALPAFAPVKRFPTAASFPYKRTYPRPFYNYYAPKSFAKPYPYSNYATFKKGPSMAAKRYPRYQPAKVKPIYVDLLTLSAQDLSKVTSIAGYRTTATLKGLRDQLANKGQLSYKQQRLASALLTQLKRRLTKRTKYSKF